MALIALISSSLRAVPSADKAVTIVTSAETLIAGKSPKLGRACLKWLQARGAKARHQARLSASGSPFKSVSVYLISMYCSALCLNDLPVITHVTCTSKHNMRRRCSVSGCDMPCIHIPQAQHLQVSDRR